jgi:hypothetical protein
VALWRAGKVIVRRCAVTIVVLTVAARTAAMQNGSITHFLRLNSAV